ncbi:MAG: diguanylate cyclase [Polyangiaceae bacterium]
MPDFTKGETRFLEGCVDSFTESFRAGVAEVLATQFRGAQPAEVVELREQLSILKQQLSMKAKPSRVHDTLTPLLKRIVIDERRRAAEAIDPPMQRAIDPQLVRHLQREVRPLEEMMATAWFQEARALRVPRLTDYLSIRFAEAVATTVAQRPRDYDEKFHILEAPALFLPDLAYYRARCAFRDAEIAVVYLDIDAFKELNTRYTETVIDLKVLPVFMELVEAHTFARGHSYRFGGDEYVLLLPNMAERWAVELLRELAESVGAASFHGIDTRLSFSAGVCRVDVDCMLTDREVLAKANLAKNFVKAREKARVAVFDGPLFREEDLRMA